MEATFEQFAAERLVEAPDDLLRAWYDRMPSAPNDWSPVALPLLGAIAAFVRTDDERTVLDSPEVAGPLAALARTRRGRGTDAHQMIRDLSVLARLLDEVCAGWLRVYDGAPSPEAMLRVTGRLNRAPFLIAEVVVAAYDAAEERPGPYTQVRQLAEELAHELRNSLCAAGIATFLLETDVAGGGEPERRRLAELIQRNLRRAHAVIGDARELAMARAARAFTPAGQRLPMSQVLADALLDVREMAAEMRVPVEVLEPVPGLAVDAVRVRMVLVHLIGNAIRYADPRKPVRWVRVAFVPGGADAPWCVRVSDNGLGIPPELQPRVFTRFVRAHPERADGSGLGLMIVREAVRQLGTEVHFDSVPGVGTTFRFTLPPAPGV